MADKKLGLVLGSGGSRGISHIGFLQALDENNIKPYCVAGCSMGSVVGGLYCKGMHPAEMKEIALKLKTLDLMDLAVSPLTNKAFLKTQKLKNILDKYFGNITFKELKIPFMCNAFDMNAGETVYFKEGSVAESVRASSSIPAIFRPLEKGDRLFIDGGTVNRMPIESVLEMGADVIVAVDVLGELRPTFEDKNLITHILRMIDAIDWNITKNKYNQSKIDLLIMPELGDMSQYLVKQLDFAYEKGYEAAIKNIDKIKELLNK